MPDTMNAPAGNLGRLVRSIRRPRAALLLTAVAAALACGGAASQSGSPATEGSPGQGQPGAPGAAKGSAQGSAQGTGRPLPEPPELRLPDTVHPAAYRVELTLDPRREGFAGAVEIELSVKEATGHIWLHGDELTVASASIQVGNERWPIERLSTSKSEFLGFDLKRTVPPGPATLRIDYRGKVVSEDDRGLFRQEEDGHVYLFSQFQATSARRAFPCFDEPRFKVPWRITLNVPKGDKAFSNAPVAEETPGPTPELMTHRFAETKPLPSYLIAVAVGPFDVVDIGKVGKAGVPARIIALHGRGKDTGYAASVMPKLVERLEAYFDIAYPYEKLDSVTVPRFFGAMENAGLITYAASYLLAKPGEDTPAFQRACAGIAGHEIAHQWFGNLVTLTWWDDTWLNESFATWMATKVVAEIYPAWKTELFRLSQTEGAMVVDSSSSARSMHQDIRVADDINAAFSPIAYGKGGAVLTMFERWIGKDAFREGVRAYMREHAWRTATSSDFLAALSKAGGGDVAAAFGTFLTQPGVPLLQVGLTCAPGQAPALSLRQERLLPTGSTASSEQTWQIPVCIRYMSGQKPAQQCTLIKEREATMPLANVKSCPAWVHANAGAAGYYRVAYGEGMLQNLLTSRKVPLTLSERIALVGDMSSLVRAGKVPAGEALAIVPTLVKAREPYMMARAARVLAEVDDVNIVPAALRPSYQRFVAGLFGAEARKLGWNAKPRDTEETRMLRNALVPMVVRSTEDAALIREARALAKTWLDTRRGIDKDLLSSVLETASRHGDAALHARLEAAMSASKDTEEREMLIGALAAAPDMERIQKNIDLLVSGTIPVNQGTAFFWTPLAHPKTQQPVYDYIKANYDALAAKVPLRFRSLLVYTATAFCDDAHRKDAESFFGPKLESLPSGKRALTRALEEIELCIAFRAAQQPSIEAFLSRY